MNSEILIIGAGIIGLSLARELHKNGAKKITILEKGGVGKEASFAAAGMLAPQAEADEADEFFRFCCDSRDLYPDLAQKLLEETGIDIELDQSGTLYAAFTEEDVAEIRERYKWQKDTGLEVKHLTAQDTHKLEPFISPDSLESLFFPKDWQVENRRLLLALEKYAELNGIEIKENCEVTNLINQENSVKGVQVSGDEVFADKVILASGAWTSFIKTDEGSLPMAEVKPIRGEMIKFQTAKRLFHRVIYSPRGYIVPRKLGRILAGATTEDVGFKEVSSDEGKEAIKETAFEIVPSLAGLKVEESWSGFRPFAADGLPIIGEVPKIDNLFVATAHYRNGILLAPMTAKTLADKIVNNTDSTYLDLCSANRFRAAKVI